jgi:hypothetical protein
MEEDLKMFGWAALTVGGLIVAAAIVVWGVVH